MFKHIFLLRGPNHPPEPDEPLSLEASMQIIAAVLRRSCVKSLLADMLPTEEEDKSDFGTGTLPHRP